MDNIKKLPHKEILSLLASILFVSLSVFALTSSVAEIKTARDARSESTITVSGEGKVYAKPDIAQSIFSVVHEGKTVEEVQSRATEGMNAVISAVKKEGVEEKDIKTTEYSIYPRYDYTEEGRIFKGYEIRQSITVKIRDLSDTGKIIDAAVSSGANQVGGLSFTIEDEDMLRAEARKEAIKEAKEKARALARDLGVRLDDIVGFSESSNGAMPVFYAERAMMGVGGAEAAPEIPTGENEIISRVNITYEIK